MDSYACGPEIGLTEETPAQLLAETAARFAERDALVVRHQRIRLTWQHLAEHAERIARGFFFFKQKTAYEFDCDWSSDVCSSDLPERAGQPLRERRNGGDLVAGGQDRRRAAALACG